MALKRIETIRKNLIINNMGIISVLIVGIIAIICGYWGLPSDVKEYKKLRENNEDPYLGLMLSIVKGFGLIMLGIMFIILYFEEVFFS